MRLLDSLFDGLCLVDPSRRIVYWNKAAERITGFDAAEVYGQSCSGLSSSNAPSGESVCDCGRGRPACPLARALTLGCTVADRVHRTHKDGRRLVLDVQAMPVRDDESHLVGAVEVFRDASAVAALEVAFGRLRTLSETDPLTGIANRRHLDAELQAQLDLFNKPSHRFCVILADLDHFKQVNDTWGHGIGDQVLQSFAHGLTTQCRPGDLVGRFGGEEFLVILPGARLENGLEIAERMRTLTPLSAPPGLPALHPTASFGVAEARPTDTPGQLLRRVDAALYRAKRQGRQRVEPQSGEQTTPAA